MIPNGRLFSAAGVVPTHRATTRNVGTYYILLNRQAYIYHYTLHPDACALERRGGDCMPKATMDLDTFPNQFDGLDFVAYVCGYVYVLFGCVGAVVLFELDTNQTNTVFYGIIQDE